MKPISFFFFFYKELPFSWFLLCFVSSRFSPIYWIPFLPWSTLCFACLNPSKSKTGFILESLQLGCSVWSVETSSLTAPAPAPAWCFALWTPTPPTLPALCLGSSQGKASAALVNTLILRKASTGDRSSEPPSGGIIPRNRFRYGSASVDTGPMINPGGFGNQVRSTRTTRTRLYKLLKYNSKQEHSENRRSATQLVN